jgi:hypothetical protein
MSLIVYAIAVLKVDGCICAICMYVSLVSAYILMSYELGLIKKSANQMVKGSEVRNSLLIRLLKDHFAVVPDV